MRSSEPVSFQPNQIIQRYHDPFRFRSQVTIPNRNSTVSDDSRAQSLSARTSSTASSERSTIPSDAPSEVGLPWHLQFAAMGIQFPVAQQIGPTYVLPCEFTFLGCNARFFANGVDDWILHSLSHFNGRDPLDTLHVLSAQKRVRDSILRETYLSIGETACCILMDILLRIQLLTSIK